MRMRYHERRWRKVDRKTGKLFYSRSLVCAYELLSAIGYIHFRRSPVRQYLLHRDASKTLKCIGNLDLLAHVGDNA